MRISDWSSDVCSSDLFRRGDRHNGDAQHRFSRELLGAGTRSPHMRIASIVTAPAAGIAAASAVAAPGQSQRKIAVGPKITNAGPGGTRNWQAGPPRRGIPYMTDRRCKWSEVDRPSVVEGNRVSEREN